MVAANMNGLDALARNTEKRRALNAARDPLILAAREEGHTWRRIAAAAGLTELATRNAAKRAEAASLSDGESPVS